MAMIHLTVNNAFDMMEQAKLTSSTYYRIGQAAYNVLYDMVGAPLVAEIRGDNDPFFSDNIGSGVMFRFIKYITHY